MIAVVAASGLTALSPLVVSQFDWHPAAAIPVSGLTASAMAKLIGEGAIAFYSRPRDLAEDSLVNGTENLAAAATA
ncbi:MAG: hypothetical protein FJ189_04335 [Gammaproteobacteria bacterium]|nr:hypothetical protein [Gammaproteobacteria bacterium]